MIINGGSYRVRDWWTKHLENETTNDRIHLFGGYGLNGAEKSIGDALRRMEEMAHGTRAKNFFYQANINAEPGETLTYEQAIEAAERLKDNLGLSGHPSILVEHMKKGRQHFHLLASRIDSEGRVVRDSFTAQIHERTSRELEQHFDLKRTRSILEKDRDFERPDYRPKKWETMRALETGITPEAVATKVQELRASADNGISFVDALEDQGFITCQGDKGRYCILDAAGDIHSLNRRVGMRAPAFRDFMQDVPVESLRTVAEARDIYAERTAQQEQQREQTGREGKSGKGQDRYGVPAQTAAEAAELYYFDRDHQARQWEDGLRAAAIAHEVNRAREAEWLKLMTPVTQQAPIPERSTVTGPELGRTGGDIRLAMSLTDNAQDFIHALEERSLHVARVTDADREQFKIENWQKPAADRQPAAEPWMQQQDGLAAMSEDHQQSARRSWQSWQEKRQLQNERASFTLDKYVDYVQQRSTAKTSDAEQARRDELVVVDTFGRMTRLSARNTGKTHDDLADYLKAVDTTALPSVAETKAVQRRDWMAARSAERVANVPENGTTAASLRHVIEATENPHHLAEALRERGFRLAQVRRADTGEPWPKRYAALEPDKRPTTKDPRPAWQQPREDELVAVDAAGQVYRFNERNSGKTRPQLEAYLDAVDRSSLPSVSAAQAAARLQRETERAERSEARRVAQVERRVSQIAHHETVQQIGQAYAETQTGPDFVAELEHRGFLTARASQVDVDRAQLQRSYGLAAQQFKLGDYVAVTEHGQCYRLDATTIHDQETNILTRLAEIDAGTQMDVGTLRAWHAEQRQERLAEPVPEPFIPMQAARDFLRRGTSLFGRTMDIAGEALSLGGSAARVAVQIFEDIMSGPGNAISGGSEEQKRHANMLYSAREMAKAMRQPPAEQARFSSRDQSPDAAAPAPESDALRNALQRLRTLNPSVRSPEPEKELPRRRDRDWDRDRDR